MLQSRKRASDTDARRTALRLDGNGDMKRFFLITLLFALMVAAPPVHGGQRVALHVSPIVAMEPALLTIRASVEPSEDNRKLSVTLDSDAYSTTSEIDLEGRNAARLNVIELRDVPSGLYEVRAVVSGAKGPIASTLQVVKIQPAPGRGR
jgi:hypothetical protein